MDVRLRMAYSGESCLICGGIKSELDRRKEILGEKAFRVAG